MSFKFRKVYEAWDKSKSHIAKKTSSLDGDDFDHLVSSFFCPGSFYYYIFDFPSRTLLYASKELKDVLNLDPATATPEDILGVIHPEDIPHMAQCERAAFNFIFNNFPDKAIKFKLSYCLRIKDKTGNYKLFLYQSIALSVDESGGLEKTLTLHTDISHLTKVNNYKVSLIGVDGEPSFYNLNPSEINQEFEEVPRLFTGRELELIRLLAEGESVNEMADKLTLSQETIKTHKRNVLAKSGSKNTQEMIAKCIKEGLI